ncbi:MAG: hypothetical protein IKD79_00515 [Oscillospiraceae bacterium]|nr:hypothetical protein [Oscillospiraceae bacterium]
MSESIIVALITGGLSLLGVYLANRKSAAVIEYRLQELEKKQDKHNKLIERTYILEDRANVMEEKMKVANHRIDDLEGRGA